MHCLTVTYPRSEDSHFDFDYYSGTHMPLCARLLAEHGYCGSVLRLHQGAAPGRDDLSYASVDLLFESPEQMQAALAAAGQEINADIANYTNVKPQMSFAQVTLNLA